MKESLGKTVRLVTAPQYRDMELINKLEDLLKKAKAGEITGIHGIAEKGSNYFVFSTRTVSRHEIAGMLLDVAIERLTDE